MKRKCKHIDITDFDTIRPWVKDCILRHKKRYDFRDLLLKHGLSRDKYEESLRTHDYSDYPIDSITREAIRRIEERSLGLKPVRIREQHDKTTQTGIDMMGFVIYATGKVKIRARDYLRARRMMLRYERTKRMTLSQAKRLVSYKGFFKYSDYSGDFKTFKAAQNIIRKGAVAA